MASFPRPMSLAIGIDSGTQSTKAVVLDLEERRIVARARAAHRLIEGLPLGHAEQHPRLSAALDAVIGEVCDRVDRSRIRAIGVSGQQHGSCLWTRPGGNPPGQALVRHEHG